MDLNAEAYRAVAKERAAESLELYRRGNYVLSVYIAGVAVESLLRGLTLRRGAQFPTNHDLIALRRTSRFLEGLDGATRDRATAAFAELAIRWSNLHRYRSVQAMRSFLKASRFDRRIRGDFLKENARITANAATTLVMIGEGKWTSSSRS